MKAKNTLVSGMMFHITVLHLRPRERKEGTVAHLFQWLFLNMLRVRFSNSGFQIQVSLELEIWHRLRASCKAQMPFQNEPCCRAGRLSFLSCLQTCPTLSYPRGYEMSPDWPAGLGGSCKNICGSRGGRELGYLGEVSDASHPTAIRSLARETPCDASQPG